MAGATAVIAAIFLAIVGLVVLIAGLAAASAAPAIIGGILLLVEAALVLGFVVVQPNSSRILILFGRYVGTITDSGLWWVNPFTVLWRRTVSLRVRNFQSDRIKVNDASGNPIEIAAVVVWRVADTAKAAFDVENYEQFVRAERDGRAPPREQVPLRRLRRGVRFRCVAAPRRSGRACRGTQSRLQVAGIEVLETRLTHLAYAPEIAEVMLRRQQAEAILAARKKMVAGAVGIVQMAVAQLADNDLFDLDPERKAAMVSNLMVVLSGDHAPTPVLNTGTLYS